MNKVAWMGDRASLRAMNSRSSRVTQAPMVSWQMSAVSMSPCPGWWSQIRMRRSCLSRRADRPSSRSHWATSTTKSRSTAFRSISVARWTSKTSLCMERKARTLGLTALGTTARVPGYSRVTAMTEARPSKSQFLWVVTICMASAGDHSQDFRDVSAGAPLGSLSDDSLMISPSQATNPAGSSCVSCRGA